MMNRGSSSIAVSLGLWVCVSGVSALAQSSTSGEGAGQSATGNQVLSGLSVWDDGLCEMSYYRATDRIYGKPRSYIRAHLVNRQWMDPRTGVKTDDVTDDAVAVFKVNMAEEIPTENYNYRYLTTLFLRRPNLEPFKLVVSSQEWCGTTFKHARWGSDAALLKTFSYFPDEGDTDRSFDRSAVPYESLFLVARDVAGVGTPRSFTVMRPLRSTHQVDPAPLAARLVPGPIETVTVPAGRFEARPVRLEWAGPATRFIVEATSPYRLLSFDAGGVRAELLHVERRAYWDVKWPSAFYETGKAP